MRRAGSLELMHFDPEIERTLRRIREEKRKEAQTMQCENQQRAIRDYFKPVINNNYSGIARQTVNANNFEFNPALINMVQQNQFGGSPLEDPNIHLAMFLEVYAIR